MKLKKSIKLLLLAGFLLLAGCANRYDQNDHKIHHYEAPMLRQAQLAKIKKWRVSGSLSVKQDQRSNIANFTWNAINQKDYSVTIFSALDLYQLQITYQHGVATLWKNGSFFRSAKTPEGLMKAALGWSIPISEAAYWLKGMPAKAGHYVVQYDNYGHIATLQQKGWLIEYNDYETSANGLDIARRIKMERPGLLVKIAISR